MGGVAVRPSRRYRHRRVPQWMGQGILPAALRTVAVRCHCPRAATAIGTPSAAAAATEAYREALHRPNAFERWRISSGPETRLRRRLLILPPSFEWLQPHPRNARPPSALRSGSCSSAFEGDIEATGSPNTNNAMPRMTIVVRPARSTSRGPYGRMVASIDESSSARRTANCAPASSKRRSIGSEAVAETLEPRSKRTTREPTR